MGFAPFLADCLYSFRALASIAPFWAMALFYQGPVLAVTPRDPDLSPGLNVGFFLVFKILRGPKLCLRIKLESAFYIAPILEERYVSHLLKRRLKEEFCGLSVCCCFS